MRAQAGKVNSRDGAPVALPVELVVLLVEGHKIGQGEAVMRGDKIDAVLRPASPSPLPAPVVAPPVSCTTSHSPVTDPANVNFKAFCISGIISLQTITPATG